MSLTLSSPQFFADMIFVMATSPKIQTNKWRCWVLQLLMYALACACLGANTGMQNFAGTWSAVLAAQGGAHAS